MADNESMNRWQIKEMIDDAISKHELRKENSFVPVYMLEIYKKDVEAQVHDLKNSVKDLEDAANDAKDRNKWLLRLVVGAVITSFIPIAIALMSKTNGGM